MKKHKKITAFVFILLTMLPLLMILFLTVKRSYARKQMTEQLEKKHLVSITVKTNEVIWIKPGKEIFLHGKMFDIKSAVHNNGYSTFSGLYDEEETAINKSIADNWKDKEDRQNKTVVQLFQLMNNLTISTSCFYNPLPVITNYPVCPQHHYMSQPLPVFSPPPEC